MERNREDNETLLKRAMLLCQRSQCLDCEEPVCLGCFCYQESERGFFPQVILLPAQCGFRPSPF